MQKIFIWGTGFIANQVLDQCGIYEEYDIVGFIDNDLEKCGNFFRGKKIYPPDILNKIKPDRIVVLADCYDEIRNQVASILPYENISIENKKYFYKQSILRRYENAVDPDIKKVLRYIKQNDLQVFNYDFTEKYKNLRIDVIFDVSCRMYYVYHKGKKLYFAKSLNTEKKVKEYYKGLLIEQDEESPHRYLTPAFDVSEGDVVIDIGVAEGNFSLEIIEKVSKVYLVETSNEWVEALTQTFKDYQEKVVIIQKFVTSISEGRCTTLDMLIKEPVHFIKMDIEGNEWDALLGAENLIRQSERLKCAICSYHSDFDETLIKDVLSNYGLECSTTPGYMWYSAMLRKSYISLKLCRGIVQGRKGNCIIEEK